MSRMNQIDPFSRIAVFLTMFFNDTSLATASGILIKNREKAFLVTALHNLSGIDPITQKPKDSNGGIPNKVCIEGHCGAKHLENLYGGNHDPNNDQPLYLKHSQGDKIDVTLLPLSQGHPHQIHLDESFLNEKKNCYDHLHVSQVCHIIGFPEGLVDRPQIGTNRNAVLPIWKTGYIASEPSFDFQEEPVVLVDAATYKGLSGAPVVAKLTSNQNRFIGIYTGRCVDKEGRSLGRVFKTRVINDILSLYNAQAIECNAP